jgi:hypothetical protein
MKKHAVILLTALAFVVGGPRLHAQASDNDGCSNATLNGDYGTTISAQILNPDRTLTHW